MILWFYKFLILKLQILRRTHVKYARCAPSPVFSGWWSGAATVQENASPICPRGTSVHNSEAGPAWVDGVGRSRRPGLSARAQAHTGLSALMSAPRDD